MRPPDSQDRAKLLFDGHDHVGGLDDGGHLAAFGQAQLADAAHGDDGGHLAVGAQVHHNFAVDGAGGHALHGTAELVAGGEDVLVGIVHQDDHAGLDQGAGFLAFDQAQTFGAGLGDGGHQFGAGRHGQFDLVIDGAGTHGADGAPESIASAGFHIFSPYVFILFLFFTLYH